MARKRVLIKEGSKGQGRFMLPGVGDGLVDPDFDSLDDAEAEVREQVGHRGGTEDQD